MTNDNASAIQTGYGPCVEARRTNNAGVAQGAEIDVTNVSSTTPTSNPCSTGGTGTTPAPWLGSGRADVAFGNTATAAIGIIDNGANLAPGGGVGSSPLHVTNGQADALVTACQLALT